MGRLAFYLVAGTIAAAVSAALIAAQDEPPWYEQAIADCEARAGIVGEGAVPGFGFLCQWLGTTELGAPIICTYFVDEEGQVSPGELDPPVPCQLGAPLSYVDLPSVPAEPGLSPMPEDEPPWYQQAVADCEAQDGIVGEGAVPGFGFLCQWLGTTGLGAPVICTYVVDSEGQVSPGELDPPVPCQLGAPLSYTVLPIAEPIPPSSPIPTPIAVSVPAPTATPTLVPTATATPPPSLPASSTWRGSWSVGTPNPCISGGGTWQATFLVAGTTLSGFQEGISQWRGDIEGQVSENSVIFASVNRRSLLTGSPPVNPTDFVVQLVISGDSLSGQFRDKCWFSSSSGQLSSVDIRGPVTGSRG